MPSGRALYLRWRPLTFADVVGQDHVVRTLRNAVRAGAPAHAYLLAGPRGTGKTSVARILFRAVNCADQRQGDPCGQCTACQTALEGRSLDLVEIDAASNRGIDDIRELREKVAFSPSELRYRVYIVDEAHELTASAWDAFLKTLEEPPPHAIFVLATTEAHKIPTTIVSRCQRFDFRRIKPDAIAARLVEIAGQEGIDLNQEAAERLARLARGGLRDAISLLDQAASFSSGRVDLGALQDILGISDQRAIQELLDVLASGQAAASIALLLSVAEGGADLRLFANDLASYLRGLLYAQVSATAALHGEFFPEELAWLDREASRWDSSALRGLLRAILEGLARIRDGGQFQLHLELAVLETAARVGRTPAETPATRTLGEPNAPHPGAEVAWPAELATAQAVKTGPGSRPTGQVAAMPASGRSGIDAAASPVAAEDWPEAEPEVAPPAARKRPREGQAAGQAAEPVSSLISIRPGGLELVRDRWQRVIEWVAKENPFVSSYLAPAELRELRDGCLVLGFPFKMHCERLADEKNRALVEQACAQVLGQPVSVRCEHLRPQAGGGLDTLDLDDPVLKFALARFGGRAELMSE